MKKKSGLSLFSLVLLIGSLSSCGPEPNYISNVGKNYYRVEFNTNGGSPVEPLFTNMIETEPVSSKEGYSLLGWYVTNELALIAFPYTVTSNVTLKALWNQNRYTVHFETNGGSPVEDLTNVTSIDSCKETIRDGYTFTGWHVSQSLDDDTITYPYVIKNNITLYASWSRNEIVPSGVNLANSKIDAMEAKSYWSFEYKENSIQFDINVTDPFLYGFNVNPGLNDNVEVVIGTKQASNPSGLNLSNTYHFLVDINGYGYYNTPINAYTWSSAMNIPEGVTISTVKANIEERGFNGYMSSFDIAYSMFGLSRAQAINNLVMTAGIRNTNSYTASNWETATGNNYLSSWTYYTLSEDGQFIFSDIDSDTVLIGGSNYSIENFSSINSVLAPHNAYSFSEEITLEKWDKKIDAILNFNTDKLILNLGRYDYYANKLSSDEIIEGIAGIVEKCLAKYSTNAIYVTSIEPLKNFSTNINSFKNINDSLKDKCSELGVNYIDTHSLFIKDNKIDTTMFKNNFVFSTTGMEKYWNVIETYL